MRRPLNGLGQIVQSLGLSTIGITRGSYAAAEKVAISLGWSDTAGVFRAAAGAVDGPSGFVIGEPLATAIVGSIPRNSLSGELADVARPLPGWHTRYLVTDSAALVAEEIEEGEAIPVAGTTAQSIVITPSKCGIVVAYTNELMRDSNAVATIESDFTLALQRGLDSVILSRLAPDSSSAFSATADPMTDIRELITPLNVTGIVSPILCGAPATLLRMATLRDGGGPVFPKVGISGGHALGMPIYSCDRMAANSLRAINGDAIGFRVSGIQVGMSASASLQMDTSPTQRADTGAASAMVSMWQNYAVAAKFTVSFALEVLRDGIASSELNGINW